MDQLRFARQLRKHMTDAEALLWRHLRAQRMGCGKFKRQQPVGPYVVDFIHFGARVVVEADGGQHGVSDHDRKRDAWLTEQGFRVLRFWNHEILAHTDAVLESIWEAVRNAPSSSPSPQPLPHETGRGEKLASILTGRERGAEKSWHPS